MCNHHTSRQAQRTVHRVMAEPLSSVMQNGHNGSRAKGNARDNANPIQSLVEMHIDEDKTFIKGEDLTRYVQDIALSQGKHVRVANCGGKTRNFFALKRDAGGTERPSINQRWA